MFNNKVLTSVFLLLVVSFFMFNHQLVVASPEVLSAESATLDVSLELPVSIQLANSGYLSYLNVDFVMVPLSDSRQTIISSDYNFDPVSFENGVPTFKFTSAEDIKIKADFLIETNARSVLVDKKVSFPIDNLDPVFLDYTLSSDVYDIDYDIENLAVKLASGEDDLFMVVFSLAKWVNNNVEYDLSTLSNQTRTASWVLENKKGVCTEYTSLFVSLARSLGIPAREVSGFAFTRSSLFAEPWEFHSWAEVYFPGVGWVLFDPTYGQFGFVDAGHVSLSRNIEGELIRNSFSWRGVGVDVHPGNTELSVDVVSTSEPVAYSNLDAEGFFLEDEISFSSYNFLRVDLTNNNNFYLADSIRVSGIDGLTFLSDRNVAFALAPFESRSFYFVFKVDDSLNKKFIYTFPLNFYIGENSFSSKFKVLQGKTTIHESDISHFLEENNDNFNSDGLDCDAKSILRVDEVLDIVCNDISARGTLCFDDGCKFIESGDSLNLSVRVDAPGLFSKPVVFNSGNLSKIGFIKFLVLDDVSVDLSKTDHTKYLSPDMIGVINISLIRDSSSIPKNTSLKIKHKYFEEEFVVGDISDEFIFTFSYPARNLHKGDNKIIVEALFQDALGMSASESLNLNVSVDNLSLFDELDFFLRKIYFWFKRVIF